MQVIFSIILGVTVPDQYFCTKHPDLNITAREKKVGWGQVSLPGPSVLRNFNPGIFGTGFLQNPGIPGFFGTGLT